jgi:hypothetical protein
LLVSVDQDPVQDLNPVLGQVEVVGRGHKCERVQVHAKSLKTRLLEQGEILELKAAVFTITPDGVVPQDVHTSTETSVLCEGIDSSGRGQLRVDKIYAQKQN